jgi:protein SDA1
MASEKLPQLQNLIKRDPEGYSEDFERQHRHFLSELEIFRLDPSKQKAESFGALVTFLGHTAACYPTRCRRFPGQLAGLLRIYGHTMHPDVRLTVLQALLLLRNRGLLLPMDLFPLLFDIMDIQDKVLRQLAYSHMIADLRKMHRSSEGGGMKITEVQLFVCATVNAVQPAAMEREVAAKGALELLSEMYRRRIWTDDRTINTIAHACLSASTRIGVSAMRFFLGIQTLMVDDEQGELKATLEASTVDEHRHSKKTAGRARVTKRQKAARKKKIREMQEKDDGLKQARALFPALQIIHDPQGLAEKLFRRLRSSNQPFEVRLLQMNMISRLIGCHQLHLLSFYTFAQRYLSSHQTEVTQILAFLVQASHELVPPDEIVPVIKSVAFNFIAERCSEEIISVGLNAVREIISRVPAVLKEAGIDDLVFDLVMYTRSHDKSVKMAARSLINTVREYCPMVLRRKDRGKNANDVRPLAFGEVRVSERVDGAELLEAYERGELVDWPTEGYETASDVSDVGDWEEESVGTKDEEYDGNDDHAQQHAQQHARQQEMKEKDGDQEKEEDVTNRGLASVFGVNSSGFNSEKTLHLKEQGASISSCVVDNKSTLVLGGPSIEATRILSTEDFERIRRLRGEYGSLASRAQIRNERQQNFCKITVSNQMRTESIAAAVRDFDSSFDPTDLEAYKQRRRQNMEERMLSVLNGREKFIHNTHGGGKTNNEKKRLKNFSMVKNSDRIKAKLDHAQKRAKNKMNKEVKTLKRDLKKRRRT